MAIIDKELASSKEDYIEDFRQNFIEDYPPAWMITEVLSFGNLNYIYSNIASNQLMKRIAGYFGLKPQVFVSWLTVLANLRNMCCHHARVWNRDFMLNPAEPKKTKNGSPDKSGGKFFNSIENLHLCTMNNQGLLALAQLILPSEILSNFEVVRVEEEASLIRIYLDESVKAEYKENPEIESKGFCEAVTIRDFPIRDKGVDLIVRRRKWYDKQNNRYFSDSYDLKAEETRYSKEFAAFLKGVYGDDSYDLPFA